MECFRALGGAIEQTWSHHAYDVAAFPRIAFDALSKQRLDRNTSTREILEWTLSTSEFPAQPNLHIPFGEPPLTVFSTPRFYIEVIFWLDGTTSIHQHSFSGAFCVLEGSSVHCRYRFNEKRRYTERLLQGELARTELELLQQGDVRMITNGDSFIHSLFHLERPTASVVVRTVAEPSQTPQFIYLRPSVAHDPLYTNAQLRRHAELAVLMAKSGNALHLEQLQAHLRRADPLSVYRILRDVLPHMTRSAFEEMLHTLLPQREELIHALADVFLERRRQMLVIGRRAKAHLPHQRYLLALILNLETRAEVLELLAAKHPREEPAELLTRWIVEMATSRLGNELGANVLGIPLDALGLQVLEGCVRGLSEAAIIELAAGNDRSSIAADAAREVMRVLKSALVLQPLFA